MLNYIKSPSAAGRLAHKISDRHPPSQDKKETGGHLSTTARHSISTQQRESVHPWTPANLSASLCARQGYSSSSSPAKADRVIALAVKCKFPMISDRLPMLNTTG